MHFPGLKTSIMVAALLPAFLALAPVAASAQSGDPIKVTIVPAAETLPTLPFIYAKAAGLFAKAGLQVTWLPLTPNSTQVAAILDSGQADFGQAAVSASFSAQAVGKDIVTFATLTKGAFMQLALTNEGLAKVQSKVPENASAKDKIKALKGLSIAISPPGNTANLIFRDMLQNSGLDPDKDVTQVTNSNLTALLPTARAGRADGFFLNPPFTTVPVVEGWGKLWVDFASGEVDLLSEAPQIVLVAKRSTLTEKPEASKRMIETMKMAFDDIHNKPEDVKKIVRETYFENIDPKVFDVAFQQLLPLFDHNMVVSQKGYEQLLGSMSVTDVNGEEVKVPYDKAFDFSLAKAVMGENAK
jgi:NitT/TauT family transport system substrate-binding protein